MLFARRLSSFALPIVLAIFTAFTFAEDVQPVAKPVNVHVTARHAEGWFPGAVPLRLTEKHSVLARVFLGRRDRVHLVMPHPAGVGCHGDACIFADNWIHNLRTTGGADWQAGVMGNLGSQPAAAAYIALSNDSGTAMAGDCAAGSSTCVLAAEITTNGLARHVAAYSHSNGTNTFADSYTWNVTGTQSVQKAGWFNATSSGSMDFEANFTQINLVATDTFTAAWTVTF